MTATWHYRAGGQEAGPVPLEQLREMAALGQLNPTDPVRPSDADDWLPAQSVSELADALSSGSPSPPEAREAGALEELQDLDDLNFTFADERSAAPVARSEADPQVISSLDELQLEFVDGSAASPSVGTAARGGSTIGTAEPAPPAASPVAPPQWYCEVLGEQLGPMSFGDLQLMVQNRELDPDDRVRREDRDEWLAARQVGGLFDKDMLRWRDEALAAEQRAAELKAAEQRAAELKAAEEQAAREKAAAEAEAEPTAAETPEPSAGDGPGRTKKRKRPQGATTPEAKAEAVAAEPAEAPAAPAAPPQPSLAIVQYYFRVDGVEHGPIEVDEFAKLYQAGRIKLGDEIREGEQGDWVPAARILNALRVAGMLGPVAPAGPQPGAFPAGLPGGLPGGMPTGMPGGMPGGMYAGMPGGATGSPPAWTPPPKAAKKAKVKSEGVPLSERFASLIEFAKEKPGLLAILAIGLLIVGIKFGWGLIGGSSDSGTYQQIAEIYQANQGGGGGDLKGQLQPIIDALAVEAGSTERAKQEMLWAARDYLLPMLGGAAKKGDKNDETFKTHMAVAKQLIGDPSLPDLGGKVPEPEPESNDEEGGGTPEGEEE